MASTPPVSSMNMKKKQKKEGQKRHHHRVPLQHQRPSEDFRIHIRQMLDQFRESGDEVYTFEANLTNFERAEVHQLCRKMGMKSKSTGSDFNRRLSVYKSKRKQKLNVKKRNKDLTSSTLNVKKQKKDLTSFTFSEEGKVVLGDLFSRYPPVDHGDGEKIAAMSSNNTDSIQRKTDHIFCKPLMNKAEIRKKLESVVSRMENDSKLKQIAQERSKLPIASFKDVITSNIESHQVVLISGETGCGKTTQVPQYLLDYMWSKGEGCKVVCTQPRRISATSVAERIAYERGESIGDSVGYKIRLESKGGRHSSIVFCTTGVLLRVLVGGVSGMFKREASTKLAKDVFPDITHIIVDEIHERDRFSDFTLAIIRDVLPLYPCLRVVLMSATLDAERFSEYFGGCPIIRVPGFTYPVKTFFLEDILSLVKSENVSHLDCAIETGMVENSPLTEECRVALDDAINVAWLNDEIGSLVDLVSTCEGSSVFNFQHSITGVTPLMVFARKGRVGDICMLISLGANCHLRDNEGKTALDWAKHENQNEAAEILREHTVTDLKNTKDEQHLVERYLSDVNPELVDIILIEQLLRKICADSKEGAVLVFLPGWDDINKAREKLSSSAFFNDSSKFLILALHSMVPSVEQKKVFKRPPNGCRKIILSTNMAETAVTIDDVVFVIDSGRMKEKSYDPYSNVSTLQSSWISKASAKQREGRAGRCQPGICYHLYSKLRAASLPDFQVPEIKRTPIEELCLQVKLLDRDCKIEDFLKKTLDPPVSETIHNAVTALQDIGALSLNEELTELGEKLCSLPIHPLTSKMLFFAILVNCLDPALTLACASSFRDPFTLPMLPNQKKKATDAKYELATLYGGSSDQLAVIAAYDCWQNARQKGQELRFCSQYFVSSSVMNMLFRMRKQLESELIRNGFIPENSCQCNMNAQDVGIIHAVVVAGLYPMVGKLHLPRKGGNRYVETASSDKVRFHSQSVNSRLSLKKNDIRPLIIYDEITRGDRGLHIKNSSIIGPLPLLLLAAEIAVAPRYDNVNKDENKSDFEDSDEEGNEHETGRHGDLGQLEEEIMSSPENIVKVVADRWLPFESTALDVAQIYCLRERLSSALLFKIAHPDKRLPEVLAFSVYAIECVLSYDGMSGIPPPESVDSLASTALQTNNGLSETGRSKTMSKTSDNFLRSLVSHGSSANRHLLHRPSTLLPRYQPQNYNPGEATMFVNGATMTGPPAPRGDALKRRRANGV